MKKTDFSRITPTRGASYPDPRDYVYPIKRYTKEVRRLYGVLERQLDGREYICDEYSLADMASWTWIDKYNGQVNGFADFPNIGKWHARVGGRSAVQRALKVGVPPPGH